MKIYKVINFLNREFYKIISLFFILTVITSCSNHQTEKDENQVIVHLNADADINLNNKGQPSPIRITLYSVKSVQDFENADYFSLVDNKNTQIQTIASPLFQAVLKPGENKVITLKLTSDSHAIGVVGGYRDINNSKWIKTWAWPMSNTPSFLDRLVFKDLPAIQVDIQKKTLMINEYGADSENE